MLVPNKLLEEKTINPVQETYHLLNCLYLYIFQVGYTGLMHLLIPKFIPVSRTHFNSCMNFIVSCAFNTD